MLKLNNKSTSRLGFTIVELLVVIVIIGILATVTVVAYTGVSNRAKATAVQVDLSTASKQLELYKAEYGVYPTTAEYQGGALTLTPSEGVSFDGYVSDGTTYYLTASDATNSEIDYYVSSGGVIAEGSYTAPVMFAKAWGSAEWEFGFDIAKSSDGSYAVVGNTTSFGSPAEAAYIAKYASDGTLSWSRTWGGDSGDIAQSVAAASDGGYVITGYSNSYKTGNTDAYIAKYTSDGTLSWSRTWGGEGSEEGKDVKQTSDGGYALVGNTNSFDGVSHVFLAKFASDGSLSWDKKWRADNSSNYVSSMSTTSDDGFVITGYGLSYTTWASTVYMTKLTSDGSVSWSKTWGGNNGSAYSVVQTSDGGYAVTGDTQNFGAGDWDAYLAKFTSDGTLSWAKTLGGASEDTGVDVKQVADGGYVLAGRTFSYGQGDIDGFYAKFNSSGTLSWSKTWGGVGDDRANGIVEVSDGYAIAGSTQSYGAGNADATILKTDSNGSIFGCPSTKCLAVSAQSSSISTSSSDVTSASSDVSATVTSPSVTTGAPAATSTNL